MTTRITDEVRDRWLDELRGHVGALEAMFARGSRLTLLVRNDANADQVFVVSNESNPVEAFRAAAEHVSHDRSFSLGFAVTKVEEVTGA